MLIKREVTAMTWKREKLGAYEFYPAGVYCLTENVP